MLDFLIIATKSLKQDVVEIYPKFVIKKSKDLMIRGGDFYAIWDQETGLWNTKEEDVIHMIDRELDIYKEKNKARFEGVHLQVRYMWDAESGSIDRWHKYVQKQLRDNYVPLDENLVFANQETTKESYATKKLSYPLVEGGSIESYEEIVSTLYSPDDRHKLEWCIGAIVTGDSKRIQKFAVLYGKPGSGKSTILNIIQMLFHGFDTVFDAESLGSATDSFALEQFKSNPLVAVSHDGDLSRIEKNTRLNSLVSHEQMVVNEKHRSLYTMRFISFLFMGTNKPVRITDAKSGLIRRLIDIYPTGNLIQVNKYNRLMKQVTFELGAIAAWCKNVYSSNVHAYDDYKPTLMMGESNDFYNFVSDSYQIFKKEDGTTLKQAWELYKMYCEDAKIPYPLRMREFKNELQNYFENYEERYRLGEVELRSYFYGFNTKIFEAHAPAVAPRLRSDDIKLIEFKEIPSILDIVAKDNFAQYSTTSGIPKTKWDDVTTTLKDIDTSKLHYLKVDLNHIVIDFDIVDENGEKSYQKNLEEASKWPATYAELSRSGNGVHLHYIYDGDPTMLSRIYADEVEIKIFTGNSSLRRQYTKSNGIDIATISSGLPIKKGANKLIKFDVLTNEKAIRTVILKNINKEYHSATKPSMDFIFKTLEDAYESGMEYNVEDMRSIIFSFAASSTNQSDYCLSLIPKLKLKSEDPSDSVDIRSIGKNVTTDAPIAFYDIEIFPNLFILNWKIAGADKSMNRMINPSAKEIEALLQYRLVGFNNKGYDNHIIYGALLGYSNQELYALSQSIINKNGKGFGEATNLSYTDIYCYTTVKQSLKKWQIDLGITHKELGLPWDEPVDESLWKQVSEYCDNDVIATEAVWDYTQGDFRARQILAEWAGMSVNDSTNNLTTRIIFGYERKPKLVYTNLEEEFPGYKFVKTWNDTTKRYDVANMYRGIDVGKGGLVISEPGMYGNVGLIDVESMHPMSAIAMNYFGEYTPIFKRIVDVRLHIKHGNLDKAKELISMFKKELARFLDDEAMAGDLSLALKLAINSVYGLTYARFPNPFKDERNQNNIIALRGALFMKSLLDEVEKRGYKAVHIKTDSIKIADITPEIIEFCLEFAKKYGYSFEHEGTFDRFTLVNDAVYIGKWNSEGILGKKGRGANEWTATGAQFKIPYVFKKGFTKEPIVFDDLTEVRNVRVGAIYLNLNEDDPENDNLRFIGKIGQFCPVMPGVGGGELVKPVIKKTGETKYDAVIGSKGHRWLETADVIERGLQDQIDISYYDNLVTNAINKINEFGDYEWFVSDDPYEPQV